MENTTEKCATEGKKKEKRQISRAVFSPSGYLAVAEILSTEQTCSSFQQPLLQEFYSALNARGVVKKTDLQAGLTM